MSEPKRVAVWGTGNVGKPAIRSVVAHRGLELVGVIVHDPAKAGRDAGDLADCPTTGVVASLDIDGVLARQPDAVVYTASGDFRPDEAIADIVRCLRAGINVVSTTVYPFLHPGSTPEPLRRMVDEACRDNGASVFVSGIDPGWALDILPLLVTGVASEITEVRAQEIFNYAYYHAPDVVREIIGFGGSMDVVPPMLWDESLQMVWAAAVRVVADGLGVEIEEIRTHVERRPLDHDVDVPGMGRFTAGGQGAFRFEVQGIVAGRPLIVMEHVTRIDDECAPDWPRAPEGKVGAHRVIVSGRPRIEITISADDGSGNPAEGGNATAAGRIVSAIPAVCAAPAGIVGPLDLPVISGRGRVLGGTLAP